MDAVHDPLYASSFCHMKSGEDFFRDGDHLLDDGEQKIERTVLVPCMNSSSDDLSLNFHILMGIDFRVIHRADYGDVS